MSRRTIFIVVLTLLCAPMLLALFAILSTTVHASPVEGTYATISNSITPKDQLVIIRILAHPGRSLTISIYDGLNTFRYNGQTVGTAIGFHAQREGEHTLLIKDADTGQTLETLYFLVQNPAPISIAPVDNVASMLNNTNGGEINVTNNSSNSLNTTNNTNSTINTTITTINSTNNQTNNHTTNQTTNITSNASTTSTDSSQEVILPTRTRLVETDKQHYKLGEQVHILLNAPSAELENLKLNIINGPQLLRFIGDMQTDMVFEPRTAGAYRVVVSSDTGDAIDSFIFVVDENEQTVSTTSVNSTNSTNPSNETTLAIVDNTNTIPIDGINLNNNETQYIIDRQVAINNQLILNAEFKKTKQTLKIADSDGNPIDGGFVITKRSTKESFAAPTLDAQSFVINEPVDVDFTPANTTPYNDPIIKHVSVKNLIGSQLKLGLNTVQTATLELPAGVDEHDKSWINAYAVDPTLLNASNVTITVTATGTELYICKDWDFANSACLGVWVKLRDVTPGQNYTITLDSSDPGFGESIPIPSVGWSKTTTTPNDLVTIRMCSDDNCTQTATNFQPGDTVFIVINSSNGFMSGRDGSQLDIYSGADTNILVSYNYPDCPLAVANYVNNCSLNFTIPDDWTGWYYIDSDIHRTTGGTRYISFRTPFTVGDEPVVGDQLQFFADVNRTRPADKFGRNYQVYVNWEANVGVFANISSNAAIKSPHYSAGVGITRIANTSITFTNRTGPYLFNFSMPTTLSDGYGGWYYFEPNLTRNATDNIPDGPVIYGRMIQYQNNTAPNLTNIVGNSPNTTPVSVGMGLMWNTTLNDTDDVDKHALYICNSSAFNYTTFSCMGSVVCKNETWSLGKNIDCNVPANRNMSFNNIGYAFICDPWNCSSSIQTNYSVYNDTISPNVTLITPINPTTINDFTATFNYFPQDDYGFVNCSLYTDAYGVWQSNNISESITNGTNNYFSYTFPDNGAYVWNVLCMDYAGNKAFGSSNYTLYVQGPQIVRLGYPPNDTYTTQYDMNFTYNVSYSSNMDTCQLLINNTPVLNDTNVNVGEMKNFFYTFPVDGAFDWNVWCNNTDGVGVYGDGVYNATIPRSIYIDTTDPTISLNSPTHNSIQNESTIYFTYTPSDNFGIGNCTLYVDDAPVETRTTIENNVNVTTPYIMENGVHYWKAQCYDRAGNFGSSTTNTVTVNSSTSGTGFTLYETNNLPGSYSNYTSVANINLSTTVDNRENRVVYNLGGGALYAYANAISLPFMTNGVLINPNTLVNFSGYFSAQTANNGYVTWKFYRHVGSTDLLICDFGNDYTGGRVISATAKTAYRASCTSPNNYTRINGNESVKLVVDIYNSNTARRTFTHFFDNVSTYVSFNFTRLGFLSTNLSSPAVNLTVGLNDTFNITCKVNCTGGSCINTQVYLETNASGVWVLLNSTKTPVILNNTETNPHNLSIIVFPGNTTVFKVIANATGDLLIRCNATSNYSNAITMYSVKISVQNTGAPTIILTSPLNGTYVSTINVSLNFTPSSAKTIQNCSLFIGGVYNKTMNVTKDITNTFNLTNPPDARYDWLVSCIDSSNKVSNSSQYTFTIDKISPQVNLFTPINNTNFTSTSIQFIWNATDNVDPSLNCNLTIDGSVNSTNVASPNGTNANKTISGFMLGGHSWNVTCIDDAGNSNWSETRYFNITNIPPNVTNLIPPTNTWTNANDITFGYNVSEPDAPLYDYTKNYSAMIVYRSTTLSGTNFPKYRTWSGTAWSAETEMATSGSPLRWIKMASSTSSIRPREKIALTTSNDAGIDAYVWNGSSWALTANLFTTTAASAAYHDFDIAYEKQSGRAIAVANYNAASAAQDWQYSIWNGTAWSAITIVNDGSYGGDALISYMHLASSPTTNDMALAYVDTASNDARVILWNGTNWYAPRNISLNSANSATDSVGVAFETITNDILAVAAEGNFVNYTFWNGSAWNQSGQFDPNTAAANTADWLTLKPNPVGNQIMLTVKDSGNDLATTLWSNGAWSGNVRHDGGVDNVASMVADYAWEPTGNKGLLMWGTATLYITMRTYASATWGTPTNVTTSSANTHAWVSLYTNPGNKTNDVKILGAMEEAGSNALGSIRWVSGTPAISVTQFATTQGTAAYQAYDVAYDLYPQSTNIFQYYPLANCSLYINNIYNSSNASIIYLEKQNNITVTSMPEGTQIWYVNCSDTDGRSGNSTPWTLKIDRTPPTINLTSPQDGANLTIFNINFSFTPRDNVATNIVCNLTVDGIVNITNIATTNNTNTTRTVNGLSDTVHYWNVTCADTAGNLNTSSTYSFNISAPPIVRLITPTNASYVNDVNLTLFYNASDNAWVQNCSLFFDGVFNQTNQSYVNFSRLNNFTINNVPLGQHTWNVSCIDNMYQTGVSSIFNFTVDRVAPQITLYQPLNNTIWESRTVQFNFTAIDDVDTSLTCNLSRKGPDGLITTNNIVVPNGTMKNVTQNNVPDGVHIWNVTCIDDARNSNISFLFTFNISAIANVTLISPAPGMFNNTPNITFTYFVYQSGGIKNCSLYFNSSTNGSMNQTNTTIINNAQNNFTLSNLPDGTYFWNVSCYDNFDRISWTPIRNFTIETTPPLITLYSPIDGDTVTNNTVSFNYTSMDTYSPSMTCNLTINGTVYFSNTNVVNGTNQSSKVTMHGGNASYIWNVSCNDRSSNRNTSETRTFYVIAPPAITLVSPNNNALIFGNATFVYKPYDPYGLINCSLIVDGVIVNTTSSPTNNSNNNLYAEGILGGQHNWTVGCFDVDGDYGTGPYRTISNDQTPPIVFSEFPENGNYTPSSTTIFGWNVSDDIATQLSCSVYIDSINRSTVLTNNGSRANATIIRIADGLRWWNVTCVDGGNNANTSAPRSLTVNQTPTLTIQNPINNYQINVSTILFTFTPSDNDGFTNCSLYLNGTIYSANTSAINNSNLNNISATLTTGKYYWAIECIDNGTYLNRNMSTDRNITINLIPPRIDLNLPGGGFASTDSWVVFNWTGYETFQQNIVCNLSIDSIISATNVVTSHAATTARNITNINDSNNHYWNVSCADPSGNYNISETRQFSVQESPKITLVAPANNTRTNNATLNFTYTPTDNSGIINNCSLIINGQINSTNNTIYPGVQNNFTVTGFGNGTYYWSINCTDPSSNTGNSVQRILLIDQIAPVIILYDPANNSNKTDDVMFNWTAYDSAASITCNLTLDGVVNATIISSSGSQFYRLVQNNSYGYHYWNVTCVDDFGQSNISDTYIFNIPPAELYINESMIRFNNTNPNINETILIRANVTNVGGVDVPNVTIAFWDGLPSGGGIYIGNVSITIAVNQTVTANISWNITFGMHTIFVAVDPEGNIIETSKLNNNASRNISVLRVNILTPANASVSSSTTPAINFTVQNDSGGDFMYKIFVDGSANGQQGLITDNTSILLNINALSEGLHRIIVQANDSAKIKNSTALFITIDTTPPVGVFLTLNNTFFTGTPLNITFRLNDTYDANIDYAIFVNNVLNISGVVPNATNTNGTLTTLANGIYTLILQGLDDAGNIQNNTPINIFVDGITPSLVQDYPANGASFTNRSVTINFTIGDNLDPLLQCNLTFDGTVIRPLLNISNGSQYNTTLNNLAEGTHSWYVACWDGNNVVNQVNNLNISPTWTFGVYINPLVTLVSPPNNTITNNQTIIFYYNVSDETGLENCSIFINGTLIATTYTTNITNNATNNFTLNNLNNTNLWSISCIDNTTANMINTTVNRTITIDTIPPTTIIYTPDYSWFNTSTPRINITATDNFAATINWSAFVNNNFNANGTVPNGASSLIQLSALADGIYAVLVQGKDDAINAQNSSSITIYVDTTAPNITLLTPINDSNLSVTNALLNFTVTDNLAAIMPCNLTYDGSVVAAYNLTNGSYGFINITSIPSGYHYWNVTCVDNASNKKISPTFRFFIQMPDLAITTDNITFSNDTPIENQTIQINATIFNIGLLDDLNATIRFYLGDPSSGGVQLGSNQSASLPIGSNITVSIYYNATIGLQQIYVLVNGSNTESNYTNNKAHKDFWVGLFEIFAGSSANDLHIGDAGFISAFSWNETNVTGSNVFVVDSESNIVFTRLQALGINISNGTSAGANDFAELDTKLGTTLLNDSINRTFTSTGVPKTYGSIVAFKNTINNVSIINSTNTASFITGILWDTSDGGSFYNGSQDIVFVTVMNQSKVGQYGTYDYEIAVPAKLRDYINGGGTITFYAEIK